MRTLSRHLSGAGCLGLLLANTSCSLLSTHPSQTAAFRADLPATTAAWVVAETCRNRFPGADPDPGHANAPVVRHHAGRFVVRYARSVGSDYRVYRNGRLGHPGATLRDGSPFHPAAALHGSAAAHHEDEAHVEVTAIAGTLAPAAIVHVDLHGAAARGRFLEVLRRNLAAASALRGSVAALTAGDAAAAIDIVAAALPLLEPIQGEARRHLVARLHLQHARAELAANDRVAAYRAAMRATAFATRLPPLEQFLDTVHEHLAVAGRRAGGLETAIARARRLIDHGDLASAANWARRALAAAPGSVTPHRLLARIHRKNGLYRAAIAEELHVLGHLGFDGDTVLRLATLHAQAGRAAAGLHLIRQHYAELLEGNGTETETVLVFLCSKTDRALAWRILQSADPAVADRLAGGRTGPACARAHRPGGQGVSIPAPLERPSRRIPDASGVVPAAPR